MTRVVNENGIKLVQGFEGLKLDAYTCPAGVLTIGYGHTKGVKKGDAITQGQAEKMLLKDLAQCGEQVQACVTVPLSDNQFAALASFVFNVGIGNFKASTVMKRLNNGEYDAVPTELSRWVKATNPKTQQKVTLPGLVARRAAEGMLWLTGTSSDDFLSSKDMPQQVHADDPRITCTVIARDGLRVRAGAGVGFDILKVLACDTKVYLLQEKDGWAAIDIEGDGAIDGWVSKDFLRGRHG